MYNTTTAYKNRVRQPAREFSVTCDIDTSTQTINLFKSEYNAL